MISNARATDWIANLTRRFPPVWGAGAAAETLRRFAQRRRADPREVRASVNGIEMTLSLGELTESALFFFPQLYNRREIKFLKSALRAGDTFVDVGSNVGFFSLTLARHVGPAGRVVGIDADQYSCSRLERAAMQNDIRNLTVVLAAVGDHEGRAELLIERHGNRGNSSVRMVTGKSELDANVIRCSTLPTILEEAGVLGVTAMKIDVEGLEESVLEPLLSGSDPQFKPRALVVEDFRKRTARSLDRLLFANGYERVGESAENGFFVAARPTTGRR